MCGLAPKAEVFLLHPVQKSSRIAVCLELDIKASSYEILKYLHGFDHSRYPVESILQCPVDVVGSHGKPLY
jgi:hypothetical protein